MKEPVIGEKLTKQVTVTKSQFASTVGSGSLDVMATPMIVALMENAAAALAQTYLEDIFTTVGTMISIDHTSPSVEGMTITAQAELTAAEGRKFCFKVTAWDDVGQISQGTHERFAVKSESFFAKASARKAQD